MFDVEDNGVVTIIAIIIIAALIGWVVISLDFSIGVIVGVAVCVLLMLFFPTIIELFI